MALEGTLRDFSLADIFQLIGLQKKTGILTLNRDQEVVTVSFVNGNVVAAESLHKRIEDRLGHVLVKSAKITREQLNQALDIQKETLQRLGYILTKEEILSEEDLKQALQVQILQTIYRLFRWLDGDYHFSQEESVEWDQDNITPTSAESILMEGIRMVDEWPMIERKIKSTDMVFRKVDPNTPVVLRKEKKDSFSFGGGGGEFSFGFGDDEPKKEEKPPEPEEPIPEGAVQLSRTEMVVYPHINGIFKVTEIIDRSGLTEFDASKALYELINRSLIEEVTEENDEDVKKAEARDRIAEQVYKTIMWVYPAILVLSLLGFRLNPINMVPSPLHKNRTLANRQVVKSMGHLYQIIQAMESYYSLEQKYPDNLQQLVDLNFLTSEDLIDPFGNPYTYSLKREGYFLYGNGPDGTIKELSLWGRY